MLNAKDCFDSCDSALPRLFANVYRETAIMLRAADLSADQFLEFSQELEDSLRYAVDDCECMAICKALQADLAVTHSE